MKKDKLIESKDYMPPVKRLEENHYQKHLDRFLKGKCRPMKKGGRGR